MMRVLPALLWHARKACRTHRPRALQEPLSIEETAQRWVRPALREAFVGLCRGSVADYLARFGFRSELLQVMYAVSQQPAELPAWGGCLVGGWGRGWLGVGGGGAAGGSGSCDAGATDSMLPPSCSNSRLTTNTHTYTHKHAHTHTYEGAPTCRPQTASLARMAGGTPRAQG